MSTLFVPTDLKKKNLKYKKGFLHVYYKLIVFLLIFSLIHPVMEQAGIMALHDPLTPRVAQSFHKNIF